MTIMLEKAFSEASMLPEIEQNVLALWVLDEIDSDKTWDKLFAESEDTLAKLASEALEEEDKGNL
ncbi:MAG: hypothetical protein LWX52_08515 [Deltaproteobacteria bacterium]|nr:hypothetical protein [Deltaproteobacteria bacterium]